MAWYNVFVPDLCLGHFDQLEVDQLRAWDCQALLIDIDNTLVPYDQDLPNEEVHSFIAKLRQHGFSLALVSNNKRKRVENFARALDLPCYPGALKPLPAVYRRVQADLGVQREGLVSLGDQLLTDVWGGHNAGVKVIWTRPLVQRDHITTRFNRIFERFIYHTLVTKGCIDEKV